MGVDWTALLPLFFKSLPAGLALLLLAGCAAPSADYPPQILSSNEIRTVFPIPTIRERMIYLAQQEWQLFGRPVADYDADPPVLKYPPDAGISRETAPPFLSRIFLYWYAITTLPIVGYEGELRPWSAAFIVWLARSAGVAEQDLPSTALHWDYIEHTLSAGKDARFIAHDARFYSPKPGDLLCAPRVDGFVATIRTFKQLRRGPYHCDLVVGQRQDGLELIGGNVLDAVSLTRVALDSEGLVRPNPKRPWLIVIEQRDID